jgi:hypothetical protein
MLNGLLCEYEPLINVVLLEHEIREQRNGPVISRIRELSQLLDRLTWSLGICLYSGEKLLIAFV